MNEKKFVFGIIGIISIAIIIALICVIYGINQEERFVLNANEYKEENALKAKEQYESEDAKQKFIQQAEQISASIYSKMLDGSIIDETGLSTSIAAYNTILLSNNWDRLGLDYPVQWIGTWFLNEQGFLKFKFKSESIEPNWVNDEDVSDYIELN